MTSSSDIVKNNAIAVLRGFTNAKISNESRIQPHSGHNSVILAGIAYYKSQHEIQNYREDLFTPEELIWFYDQLKHDGKAQDYKPTVALTNAQRRELLYTLFRYWYYA